MLHPKRIVVNRQGQEPYPVGIVNALHGLMTLGANEHCAGLAFVDLLFRAAGIRHPWAVRVGGEVPLLRHADGLFSKNWISGVVR
jgi:hypothetical protein